MNDQARLLQQRYRREPRPGAPNTSYLESELDRIRSRYNRRQKVVQQVLNKGVYILDRDPELVEELIGYRVFTQDEIAELIDVARRAEADEGIRRRHSQANAALASMVRKIDKEWKAQAEAERRAAIEVEARSRLGWPAEGLPQEVE